MKSFRMLLLWILIYTIVITDPYRGLQYDEIQVYIINEPREDYGQVEYLSDGYSEPHPSERYKEDDSRSQRQPIYYNTSSQSELFFWKYLMQGDD